MSDPVLLCGTGNWTGPKPGDPNNDVLLSATTAFGGVDVSWSYPTINPAAVAHINLYRGITDDIGYAVPYRVVTGNYFFDKNNTGTTATYFYWIQIVSVNGTEGSIVGPASAVARATIEETMEMLTGRIDAGALANELKADIGNVALLGQSITDEVAARIAANQAISATLSDTQEAVDTALTLLETETQQRITENGAVVTSLNLLASGFGESVAGVATEVQAITSKVDAISSWKITTEASLNGDEATGTIGITTSVNELTDAIDGMMVAKLSVNGLIGGFGIHNDGNNVEAGFDVDNFWIGRTQANKRKPFIIDGATGETYIDKAVIPILTADKIDSRGLSIRDTTGNVIVSAGSSLANSTLNLPGNVTNAPAEWLNSNAIATAAADATTKANAAKAAAIAAAATAAQAKADLAKTQAQAYADGIVTAAEASAIAAAQTKADAAQAAAISAAAADASAKANVAATMADYANLSGTPSSAIANSAIKIGGANLMRNSGQWKPTSTAWISNGSTVSIDSVVLYGAFSTLKLVGANGVQNGYVARLKPNTTYTCSAMVKGSSALAGSSDAHIHIQVWRDEDTANLHQESSVGYGQDITTSWTLVYQTFTTPASATLTYCRMYFYPLAAEYTLNVGYVKLEEGNVPTDWTPCSEDAATVDVSGKLDKAGAAILTGPVSLNAATAILVGDTTNGLYLGNTGIVGRKGGQTTFAVDQAGNATFSGNITGSQFTTGAFTGYAWPAAGNYGTYLGPSGLRIGNANNGKYFQITHEGNLYSPGFYVENGVMTISQANVINTLNIAGNSVTVTNAASGTAGTVSTSLTVPSGQTMKIVTIATSPGLYEGGSAAGGQMTLNATGAATQTTIRMAARQGDTSTYYMDAATLMTFSTVTGPATASATASTNHDNFGAWGAINIVMMGTLR